MKKQPTNANKQISDDRYWLGDRGLVHDLCRSATLVTFGRVIAIVGNNICNLIVEELFGLVGPAQISATRCFIRW